jgi:hypothetical protein
LIMVVAKKKKKEERKKNDYNVTNVCEYLWIISCTHIMNKSISGKFKFVHDYALDRQL